MKILLKAFLFIVLAPIVTSIVGLGGLVIYKGTIYFDLKHEIELILGIIPKQSPAAKTEVKQVEQPPVTVHKTSYQPASTHYQTQTQRTGPATANELREEYYGKAGVSAQWVQQQLYGTPGEIANFEGDSSTWTDKQHRIYQAASQEQSRYNEAADNARQRRTITPLTAQIIRTNLAKWAQSGRFPSYECKLAYYLSLNCTHYQNGTVDEATARTYLDKTLAEILPQIQFGREQKAIAAQAWEKDRPAREIREAIAAQTAQQQKEAQMTRQQMEEFAAEQATLREEIEEARRDAENERSRAEVEAGRIWVEKWMRDQREQADRDEQQMRRKSH